MRVSSVLLRTGCLAAHRRHCLMLLGSPPDMVHSCRSRKTHSSPQPKTALTTQVLPSFRESTPAVADCRYRAPLFPRLVWPYFTSYRFIGTIGIGGIRTEFSRRRPGRTLSHHTIRPLYHIFSEIARVSRPNSLFIQILFPYTEPFFSSSSITSSLLYFSVRSARQGAPVLIKPAFRPTARSAMVVSPVSPERWERIVR